MLPFQLVNSRRPRSGIGTHTVKMRMTFRKSPSMESQPRRLYATGGGKTDVALVQSCSMIKVYAAQPTARGDSHAVTHLATWKDMATAFWPLQHPSGPGRQSQHKRPHFATNVTKACGPVTDGSRIWIDSLYTDNPRIHTTNHHKHIGCKDFMIQKLSLV